MVTRALACSQLTMNSHPEISYSPPIWRQRLAAPPSAPLFAWDDLILVGLTAQGNEPPRLLALRREDGQVAWEKQMGDHFVHHLAAASPSPLFYTVLNSQGQPQTTAILKGWDKQGVEQWQWQAPVEAQLISRLALHNDSLWFTANGTSLWHVSPQNNQASRRFPLAINASWARPLVTPNLIIIPGKGPRLLALDHEGRRRWLYDASAHTSHWLDRVPVLSGERLVTSFSRALVACLDVNTGQGQWRVEVGPTGKELSGITTNGELAFVGARDGVYALSLEDGRIVWHYPTPRTVQARPLTHNDTVIFAGHDHHVTVLAAATGELLWQSADWGARLEESPLISGATLIAINRRGDIGAMVQANADELLRHGLWQEAIVQLEQQGQQRRVAEVREMFDHPLRAAYTWEKFKEWEKAAILYEAAQAWEYAAALWHQLGQRHRYAEALFNHAQNASTQSLTDEEMAICWERAAKAFIDTDQQGRAADSWRQVARYRRLPVLKITVVPEHALIKNQRNLLNLFIRNEGYGPAHFPTVRASGQYFARNKLMTTRHYKQLRDYDEVQETLTVQPIQAGEAIPLRFTVEYKDDHGQIHLYQETVTVTVNDEESGEISQVFYLNQQESEATVSRVINPVLPLDDQSRGFSLPTKKPAQLSNAAELFEHYNLPVPDLDPILAPSPAPAEESKIVPSSRPLNLRIDAFAPKSVIVAQPFQLAVALRQPTSPKPNESGVFPGHSGHVVVSASDKDYVPLRLQINCSDCQLMGPETRAIRYHIGQDSPVYAFHLVPNRTGPINILVSVLQEEVWLGDAYVNTTAEEKVVGKVEYNVISQPVETAVELRITPEQDAAAFPVEMRLLDRGVVKDGWFHLDRPALLQNEQNAHQYGQALGQMLFTGDLGEAYQQAVSVLEAEQSRLHVRLWLDESNLHDLAWERLYQPWLNTWDRLGSNGRTPFSRFVVATTFARPRPLADRPVRLLAVLASPENIDYFNLAPIPTEERAIYKAIWAQLDGVEATVLESGTANPPTMKAIRAAMDEGYHIIHFLCHGALGKQGVILYLEDEAGQTDLVKTDRMIATIRAAATPPLLINLTTCQSGRYDAFIPLAPRLITEAGVQAVLAMNGPIRVDTARLFSEHFYQRLLHHGLVDLATNQARALIHDQADWGIPVLFSRLPDNRLLSVGEKVAG